jgi:hypothetical protein
MHEHRLVQTQQAQGNSCGEQHSLTGGWFHTRCLPSHTRSLQPQHGISARRNAIDWALAHLDLLYPQATGSVGSCDLLLFWQSGPPNTASASCTRYIKSLRLKLVFFRLDFQHCANLAVSFATPAPSGLELFPNPGLLTCYPDISPANTLVPGLASAVFPDEVGGLAAQLNCVSCC